MNAFVPRASDVSFVASNSMFHDPELSVWNMMGSIIRGAMVDGLPVEYGLRLVLLVLVRVGFG